MYHPGCYRPKPIVIETKPKPARSSRKKTKVTKKTAIIYSNRDDDTDVCIKCYEKMNASMKKKLNLKAITTKSNGTKYYWCDVCNNYINVGKGKESKLQILLSLKDNGLSALQLVEQTSSYPWPFQFPIYPELIRGGMNKSLAKSISEILNQSSSSSSSLTTTTITQKKKSK